MNAGRDDFHKNEPGLETSEIAFEHVAKAFGDRKILDDVSFSLNAGEVTCILGRSGTGKSVSLRLMIGLLKPDAGRVLVQGIDIASLNTSELSQVRRKMGFLFQSAALFDSLSVRDNLRLPLRRLHKGCSPAEMDDLIEDTLKQVGLTNDANKMPSALSGGMQKRAGLARALVMKPEILLIDEPSSGLDRITASAIDDLLLQIKTEQNSTIVVVTHDIHGAIRIGDKFVVLDRTRLLAFGTPEELSSQDDEYLNQFISETTR